MNQNHNSSNPGANASGAQSNTQGDIPNSREGDPRKQDQQDLRTASNGDGDGVPKDDPSRAPESGTP